MITRLDVPTRYVDANPPDQGHIDLELMRQCRHHVIANSSFSWWGAWLGESHEQVVYVPEPWFSGPSRDTSNVIPVHWIKRL